MKRYDHESHLSAIDRYHKQRAKLPIDEKLRILFGMQEIAKALKGSRMKAKRPVT